MKTKKIFSLVLCFFMLSCALILPAYADDSAIVAYVTFSRYGEIVNDKNGTPIACAPVSLSGQDGYTIDDVLKEAHNLYFEGGADAGYKTATTQLGLGITKLLGDESGRYGYYSNGASAWSLVDAVEHNDYIEAFIYENSWPDTESYTKFESFNIRVEPDETVELILEQEGMDENWNTFLSPCVGAKITVNGEETEFTTDSEGKVQLSFSEPQTYIISAKQEKTNNNGETVTAISAPICVINVTYAGTCITVPESSELVVSSKGDKHFVSFTELSPTAEFKKDGLASYWYELENEAIYNYRISSEDYVTYAGLIADAKGFTVTEEMLADGNSKNTIDTNTASNNGYNTADIYLNINPSGHLRLSQIGDVYQLVPLRNWETVDSTISNYFIEPDYHYSIIDENGMECNDVISIDDNGLITAISEGVAIVLVTYDAINYIDADGGPFFGAIWPENTGVFVVSVGETNDIGASITVNEGKNTETIKLSGDCIDSEHDCVYFTGDFGTLSFTPEISDCEVYVANPTVDSAMHFSGFEEVIKNDDNSYTIPLKEGRNVVKLIKDGDFSYQIITAKKVNVSLGSEVIHPGDTVNIKFDTLYHPANKLAGVYNMSAKIQYLSPAGEYIYGESAQYTFASSEATQMLSVTIPADYEQSEYLLTDGAFSLSGYGDAYGNHRGITLTDGKAPNLTAEERTGVLGVLPDIKIPVTPIIHSGGGESADSRPSSSKKHNAVVAVNTKTESDTVKFLDVQENDWFYEAVEYAVSNNILKGTSNTLFEPKANMTRAMLVTVLHRMEGAPALDCENPFSDVAIGAWYENSVLWAKANNIVNGVNDSLFAPDECITREQMATILHRYELYKGYNVQVTSNLEFDDAVDISSWALDAMTWANNEGIMTGTGERTISPKSFATRAECAEMLMRFMNREK